MNKNIFLFFFFIWLTGDAQPVRLNDRAVCFYYNWYGSHRPDGKPWHWAHEVMPENERDSSSGFYPGNGNIGADFYPQAGEYNSADPAVVEKHMQQIAAAGIGIIAVTWLGEDDYTYRSVPVILEAAGRHGIKICFQIEPRVRKTALSTRHAVEFIIGHFGKFPAFYRDPDTGRPLFFVYDSYVIPAKDWADVLDSNGSHSIRHTSFDADMIGLWVTKDEQQFFLESGFDGFYTYFASAGFTFGSTPANWPGLQQWADEHDKIFIPSVGPGYLDTRVRPWNARNTKGREGGAYYDRMFKAALNSNVKWIGITSYNEWHEGTQIEPAKPFVNGSFRYKDYTPHEPDYYLKKTRSWLQKFK